MFNGDCKLAISVNSYLYLSPYDSWDGLQLNWNPDLNKWKKMDGIIFIYLFLDIKELLFYF